MSSAQDEFNHLVNSNKVQERERPSQAHDTDSDSESERDLGDTNNNNGSMPSATTTTTTGAAPGYIPRTIYDANTGPKGVIADAQAFEAARKKSFRRSFLSFPSLSSQTAAQTPQKPERASPESEGSEGGGGSEDEEFMRRWRENRMAELQTKTQNQAAGRRSSPSRRVWGSVQTVDAGGYLDAIEKVPADVVVVVCIYDPEVSYPLPYLSFFLSLQESSGGSMIC